MSTNHTQNYDLCQWEAGDKVLRTDFNDDNRKIDAALAAQQQHIGRVEVKTSAAFAPDNLPFAAGVYKGGTGTINLGFRPRAVLVVPENGVFCAGGSSITVYGGFAVDGADMSMQLGEIKYTGLSITDTGFRVSNAGATSWRYSLSLSGNNYFYIAFR